MTPPTVPCPGCAAPMGLEQEVCGACRRPRDPFEIEDGRRALAEAVARRERLPLRVALWLAAAAALVPLYRLRGAAAARWAAARAEFSGALAVASDPARRPGGAEPRTEWGRRLVSTFGPPRSPRETADVPMPTVSAAPAAAARPAAPAPRRRAVPMAEPAPAPGDLRKLYGVVYELDTGLSVPGALVHLGAPGSTAGVDTAADADGRWTMEVNRSIPDDGRATLTVRVDGKPVRAVNDSDPPYMTRTAEMRAQDLAALREYEDKPVPLEYDRDADSVRVNLVVVPPPR